MADTKTKSYALGMDVGFSFKQLPVEFDIEALLAGLNAVYAGAETDLTDEQYREAMQEFQQELQVIQTEIAEKTAAQAKGVGEAFLAENKDKDGVVVTESGLQYEVLVEGDGEMPTADSTVTVHYTGTLTDGTVFDSSVERGEPATFPVKGVIAGWTEALQLMAVGTKLRLTIPSDLAYGERGAGQQIGPHSTLIFEVELLEVK